MATHRFPLPSTIIVFILTPFIAFTIAFAIHHDFPDAFGATIVYFVVSYVISFPIFRLLPYHGVLASLAALTCALPIAWFGFWWGGMGVGAALALSVALPRSRDSARISQR